MTVEGVETKARLLTHARDLYLEDGFARFSLREVARRSKVSAAAVYRHYDGKEALLREVCAEGFRIFSSYLLKALSAPTPKARLARCAHQYLRFGVEHPRDYRFIFMGSPEDFAALKPTSSPEQEPTFNFLVDRIRECIEARVLRKGDAHALATVVWANVHGLVSLRLSGHLGTVGTDADFEALYVNATDELIDALAP
jgi:AcrR family transcriptional regulator